MLKTAFASVLFGIFIVAVCAAETIVVAADFVLDAACGRIRPRPKARAPEAS